MRRVAILGAASVVAITVAQSTQQPVRIKTLREFITETLASNYH